MSALFPGAIPGLDFLGGLFVGVAGASAWDPTLAFVMAGAILPMALAWRIQRRMPKPLAGDDFHVPATRKLDAALAAGALLFGIGWGLTAICPGPAIANLGLAPLAVLPFLAAMLAGMLAGMLLHLVGGAGLTVRS